MIFLLPRIETAIFWMKNTLIPLSVAFIDKDGVILEIHDMQPGDPSVPDNYLPRTRSDSNQVAFAPRNESPLVRAQRGQAGRQDRSAAGDAGESSLMAIPFMPLPIDYHSHPQAHSIKPYTPELLQPWADSAREHGLKEICFTDHDRYLEGVDFDEIDDLRAANPDLKILGRNRTR